MMMMMMMMMNLVQGYCMTKPICVCFSTRLSYPWITPHMFIASQYTDSTLTTLILFARRYVYSNQFLSIIVYYSTVFPAILMLPWIKCMDTWPCMHVNIHIYVYIYIYSIYYRNSSIPWRIHISSTHFNLFEIFTIVTTIPQLHTHMTFERENS